MKSFGRASAIGAAGLIASVVACETTPDEATAKIDSAYEECECVAEAELSANSARGIHVLAEPAGPIPPTTPVTPPASIPLPDIEIFKGNIDGSVLDPEWIGFKAYRAVSPERFQQMLCNA